MIDIMKYIARNRHMAFNLKLSNLYDIIIIPTIIC